MVKPVLSVPAGMEGLGDLVGTEEGREPKAEAGVGAGGLFMPYSITKGKGKAAVASAPVPVPAAVAPELDFFGLGKHAASDVYLDQVSMSNA